ncbi:hypothetical protein [uncultured Actinomyces sp.]|uniref:hypothetical protein n=1 Tax=uncultured Actinomyces sp. TaxID=249061 RepID=UPI0028EC86DB|nr:hypothetical protein [uncultured Actinomyces sp.]
MKIKIWAAAAALTIAALALPYGAATNAAAEDMPPMTAQVTKATSSSRQTSSEVTVAGTWATPKLAAGQSFTVGSVDGGFKWQADFPFVLDDGSRIGDCKATEAVLKCTVTEVPAAYADKEDVSGSFHARAQLTDKAVGTEKTAITLNGETVRTLVWGDKDGTGVCSNDCGAPAHYEYAKPENVKYGWTNRDGSIGWGIQWKIDAGVEYTIIDETNTLHAAVKCSTGPTWAPETTSWTDGKLDATKHIMTFTPPAGSLTCVTYPDATKPVEGQTTYTNRATINGASLEATASVEAAGGTDGDGTVKPTPAPEPKPTSTPTTPAPTTESKPTPTLTTEPTQKPTTQAATPAPQERLAKTGATTDGLLLMIGAIVAGAGAGLLILRLLEGPATEDEKEGRQ